MAKTKSVPLPDYPSILLFPLGSSWRGSDMDKCLDALADHYKLDMRFSELPVTGLSNGFSDKESELWFNLAWALMRDFVPAFGKERPRAGTPQQEHTKIEPMFPHAHEARLVQIVGALRRMRSDRDCLRPTQPPTTK
jgi:hypothetical protein